MRQPLREGGEFALPLRPKDEMPMVRHQAVSEQPGRMRRQRFAENAFERLVVAVLLKQRQRATARFKT